MIPKVTAVHLSPTHTFSKNSESVIILLRGLGVEGDAHCGKLMKHRSRIKAVPIPPNLRQVHLIHSELFMELKEREFDVAPGQIGENITTQGLDLLSLPRGTKLHIGQSALVEVTGLRNPCSQLNDFKDGLLSAVVDTDSKGNKIVKAGIMGIILEGGAVMAGDEIRVEMPEKPYLKLERV